MDFKESIGLRLPGGEYFNFLRMARRMRRESGDFAARSAVCLARALYFRGKRYCLRKKLRMTRVTGEKYEDERLFHFTFSENVAPILENGLKPGKFGVFLERSDDDARREIYYNWKAPGRSAARATLIIDARAARGDGCVFWATDRARECVTGFLPAKYIKLWRVEGNL